MTLGKHLSLTNGLTVFVAALALLLVVPFAIAGLEANPVTGSVMRAVGPTPLEKVVSSYSADALAITAGQQAHKAAGQASFFCYAWQCRRYVRTSARRSGGMLKTTWHLYYPKGIFGRPHCKSWVGMSVDVTSSGRVVSRLLSCA